MDTQKDIWHPILKINDNLVVMAKHEFKNIVYALLYKHTFSFVTPRKLLESEIFNIKYQNPKDIHTIAEKLRYYRHKKGLLQKDVAKYVNINPSTYISYESVNRDYYPIDILKKIANLYQINVTELMDEYNLFIYYGQGKKLKELINNLNWTKKDIAKKLRIHAKTITSWENEKVRMSKNTYIKIFKDKVLT